MQYRSLDKVNTSFSAVELLNIYFKIYFKRKNLYLLGCLLIFKRKKENRHEGYKKEQEGYKKEHFAPFGNLSRLQKGA